MKNFGRGMWRRVGDFEKFHVPQINTNEVQQYLDLIENLKKQRQQNFSIYQKQMMQVPRNTVIDKHLLVKEDLESIDENFNPEDIQEVVQEVVQEYIQEVVQEVVQEDVQEDVQEVVSIPELTNIIPKKSKKKNKSKN